MVKFNICQKTNFFQIADNVPNLRDLAHPRNTFLLKWIDLCCLLSYFKVLFPYYDIWPKFQFISPQSVEVFQFIRPSFHKKIVSSDPHFGAPRQTSLPSKKLSAPSGPQSNITLSHTVSLTLKNFLI